MDDRELTEQKKMKTKVREILIVIVVLALLAFLVGCEEDEYDNGFQYSEYEWTGPLCDDFFEYVCWKAQIDYEGEWRVSCPKDGIAFFERRCDGWTSANISIDATVEPMRVACRGCLYPIGRDWKIIDLTEGEYQ